MRRLPPVLLWLVLITPSFEAQTDDGPEAEAYGSARKLWMRYKVKFEPTEAAYG